MPAYSVTGGPCHYDVHLCYYLFLSTRYVRANVNNPASQAGRRWINRTSIRQQRRLTRQFHDFYNPDRDNGNWRLYSFGRCCNFHVDITINLPPAGWFGLNEAQIRARLPAGCGMIVIDDLGVTEHPHASIGGLRLLVDRQGDKETLAHEIGHNLGLPDDYRTPAIPDLNVPGNGMTAAEERRHRGHLMGKKRNGRRTIQQHEIDAIARATGMTCDPEVCCPKEKRGAKAREKVVERREAALHEDPDAPALVGGGQFAFGAHAGAMAPFDLAAELIGQTRLDELLKKRKRKPKSKRR